MSKAFFDPFDKPPALSTRSSTGSLTDTEMNVKQVTIDAKASTSTARSQSPSTRQVLHMYAPVVSNGIIPVVETWLAHFCRYTSYRQTSEADQLALFPLFLKESVIN